MQQGTPRTAPAEPAITLGTQRSGAPMTVRLEDLRRHACIFAGSGSGKTVLLRRIVEAFALEGVSAIVLDPNNDLARFGSPWPVAPDNWLPGDEARAAEYCASLETVVWTPRWRQGARWRSRRLAGSRLCATIRTSSPRRSTTPSASSRPAPGCLRAGGS